MHRAQSALDRPYKKIQNKFFVAYERIQPHTVPALTCLKVFGLLHQVHQRYALIDRAVMPRTIRDAT